MNGIKRRRGWRIGLAALAAVTAAALGLTAPAHAQARQPSRPVSAPGPTTQSLQSLDKERPPAGSKRWVVNDPVAYAQAVKTGKWVRSPYGLSYGTCVYRAPDNATVEADKIISPSGTVQHITPCTHPTLTNGTTDPGSTTESSVRKPATGTIDPLSGPCVFAPGGVYWAGSCYGTDPNWVGYMYEEYAVPSDPAKDGALIFLWGGLENSTWNTLLQDVLTWGANGSIVTNPNIWYVTNWYLWPGNNSVISPSMHVAVNDTIVAILNASNCNSAGDNCNWQLQSVDENDGASVTLNVTATVAFDAIFGAIMEVPRAVGCVETPTNGHAAFRDLEVIDGSGDRITPDFGASTPDPQCSVSIKASPTGGDILWKP
jgi:hypothetical protein